jgi:hypothetical protein
VCYIDCAMYDYEDMPATSRETYSIDDPNWGLKKIQDQLNWALGLPADPGFNKLCSLFDGAEGIIKQIREKCKNADDLAKITMAIEAMREELIEESACRFERATHA